MRCVLTVIASLVLAGCAGPERHAAPPPLPSLTTVFPGVRVNIDRGIVAFDGLIATDVHNPDTPDVYLEVAVCSLDTREHEALVVTRSKPAHIHAALLLIGLQPGSPGRFEMHDDRLVAIEPSGPPVRVSLRWVDESGVEQSAAPEDWVTDAATRATIGKQSWVFAGSQLATRSGREVYRADIEGTIIGLSTFGTETIALSRMHHPDTAVEQPAFLALNASMPKFRTPVVVVIEAIRDRSEP